MTHNPENKEYCDCRHTMIVNIGFDECPECELPYKHKQWINESAEVPKEVWDKLPNQEEGCNETTCAKPFCPKGQHVHHFDRIGVIDEYNFGLCSCGIATVRDGPLAYASRLRGCQNCRDGMCKGCGMDDESRFGHRPEPWEAAFDELFTTSFAGDSGINGSDPQEPRYEWTTENPAVVKNYIITLLEKELSLAKQEGINLGIAAQKGAQDQTTNHLNRVAETAREEGYEKGQDDAFRGKIQNMKTIEVSEIIEIPKAMRDYLEKEARQSFAKEVIEKMPMKRGDFHDEGYSVGYDAALDDVKALLVI